MKCVYCSFYKPNPENSITGQCAIVLPRWAQSEADRLAPDRFVRHDDGCDLGQQWTSKP